MRYATPAILLFAAALFGGCLTVQPPTITANSVSNPDVGRKGFSFPIPPGYQASTPEEFETQLEENKETIPPGVTRAFKKIREYAKQNAQSVIIYGEDALTSRAPFTIALFNYKVYSIGEPFDRHTALRDTLVAKESSRVTTWVETFASITASETVMIRDRPWSRTVAIANSGQDKIGYTFYILSTYGNLNERYNFQSWAPSTTPAEGINIVDYMAEHMEF